MRLSLHGSLCVMLTSSCTIHAAVIPGYSGPNGLRYEHDSRYAEKSKVTDWDQWKATCTSQIDRLCQPEYLGVGVNRPNSDGVQSGNCVVATYNFSEPPESDTAQPGECRAALQTIIAAFPTDSRDPNNSGLMNVRRHQFNVAV